MGENGTVNSYKTTIKPHDKQDVQEGQEVLAVTGQGWGTTEEARHWSLVWKGKWRKGVGDISRQRNRMGKGLEV